jgi:hypothetical protein
MKFFLSSLFLISSCIALNAQIVFNSSVTRSGNSVSSLTQAKTIPAGADRLIYVGITIKEKNISSVTWNGLALTQFTVGSRAGMSVAIYYLALGSSASATTANVIANFSGGTDAFMGIADYSGVYQAAPFANPKVAQNKSTTPSITFTSSVGHLAVSLLGNIAATPTSNGSGQNQYWTLTGSHSNRSTSKPGAASITMSHSINANENWVLIGGTLQDKLVMPIELVDFSAEVDGDNQVNFKWQTATETNNNYFEIEKSEDAFNFHPIASFDSKAVDGNSIQSLIYEPCYLEQISKTSYFRLKQVDFSGEFEISKVISVAAANEKDNSVVVFPNPNNGEFQIKTKAKDRNTNMEIFIHDQNQALVYNGSGDVSPIRDNFFNFKLQNVLKPVIYRVIFMMNEIKYSSSLLIQ